MEKKEFISCSRSQPNDLIMKWPVSIEGDPVDLGFAVAAVTDNSIRWESDGIAFFIASETLSKEELIEVASSMSAGEMK